MSKMLDLINKKFGRWIVLSRASSDSVGNAQWMCRCECGTEATVRGDHLRHGHSVSCGCYRREWSDVNKTQHGQRRRDDTTTEYNIWTSMKARCFNPRSQAFKYYGGRGITMCDEWRDDFKAFFDYVGQRPHGLSIDRIDNDKGYFPGNIRWATPLQQSHNSRRYKGSSKSRHDSDQA